MSQTSGSSQGFKCSTCGRQYGLKSHLRRHEATHSGTESFTCPYCHKSFGRRDVWRKHYLSCPENHSHEPPPPAKRGKTARACDACFRSKLGCDGNSPCARCTSRQIPCTHSRKPIDAQTSSASSIPGSSGSATPEHPKDSQAETKIPVSFLLSLTNPEAESMIGAFLNEPSRDAELPPPDLPSEVIAPTPAGAEGDASIIPTDGFGIPWFLSEVPFADPNELEDFAALDLPAPEAEPTAAEGIDPALAPIVAELEALHRVLSASSLGSSSPSHNNDNHNSNNTSNSVFYDHSLATQIFTRANRDSFISAYFRNVHKHLPMVHRPTFAVEALASTPASAPPLVLAIFLCGALYAPPRDSALAVPRFFPIAEEYIFRELERLLRLVLQAQSGRRESSPTVKDAEGGRRTTDVDMALYHTLQAAMLVQGAQFMLNNPAARSRSFKARRVVLVDAVRKLGLTRARHAQEVMADGMPDWMAWVRDEIKIKIGTMLVLSGWQQAGVFNEPGPMVVYEMAGEMPSIPELWEARNPEEFNAVVAAHGNGCWRRTASLRDCMDAFMDPSWSGMEGFPLKNLTLLDMFIMVSTIHSMIGSAHHFCLLHTTRSALRTAMVRWKEMWDAIVASVDSEVLRMSGFARHCDEFYWLGLALLDEVAMERFKMLPYFQAMGHETPRELHVLLRELRDNVRKE